MTLYDLGTIDSNAANKRDNLTVTTSAPDDIFKFRTLNSRSINLMITDLQGGDADLQLYRDSNNNGTLQIGTDQLISSSTSGGSNDDEINRWGGQGTYFARVYRYNSPYNGPSVRYDFYYSATKQNAVFTGPPNLLSKEENLGNLTSDRSFQNRSVGFSTSGSSEVGDTSDLYAFTLGAGHTVNIRLDGLNNNADIRLIRDSDNDRIVDGVPNEQVASSTRWGTTADVIPVSTPGDYYLQVYPTTGSNIEYDLTFDYT
jgi:hypothetical protein